MKRYRIDRRPIRYQQWPYEFIVGGFVVYLVGYGMCKASSWVWSLL